MLAAFHLSDLFIGVASEIIKEKPPALHSGKLRNRTVQFLIHYSAVHMEVLYPLLRTLNIDPREIFNPEMGRESHAYYQLRTLIDKCSEEEAATILPVCEAVLSALRNKEGTFLK